MSERTRRLPQNVAEISPMSEILRLIASRYLSSKPCVVIRYGDTSGRVIARPEQGTSEYNYLRSFLGSAVTPENIDYLACLIEKSVQHSDVIGLRSDLFGPNITSDIIDASDDEILARLAAVYPIRDFEVSRLGPDDAHRLAQTRAAMEKLEIPASSLLSDAWVHVSLAETGFLTTLMREAPRFSIITSTDRRAVIQKLVQAFPGKLRYFECPSYPWIERTWGADHSFIWSRWTNLVYFIEPSYPGEPLFISSGIWTKALAPAWASRGGIAIDTGSIMDYFDDVASRPAVLATRYGNPGLVPEILSLDRQLATPLSLQDFLK